MKYDDREPQRFLGIPVPPGGWKRGLSTDEQRVFGLPRSWFVPKPIDIRWMRHPVHWSRWRWQVHRLGPYAPPYAEPGDAGAPGDRAGSDR